MNRKNKKMILEDIQLCEEALKNNDNREFYRSKFQKYKSLDSKLWITEKAKGINGKNEINFNYEIRQLIERLNGYLIMKDFPNNLKQKSIKITIKNRDGIIGNANSNYVDKKTNINTTVNVNINEDSKRKGLISRLKVISREKNNG